MIEIYQMDVDHLYMLEWEKISQWNNLYDNVHMPWAFFTLKGAFELRNYSSSPIDM